MRGLFAILLSCLLSLNFFLYSEDLSGYSAGFLQQNAASQRQLENLRNLNYYRAEFKDEKLNYRIAILRFQSDNNLLVDGIAGKNFKAAMDIRLKQKNPFLYQDYVKNPPTNKTWIAINKSKRILTVYWNKTAIKKYPIAIGRAKHVTPEGKFKIRTMTVNPAWSGAGYADPVAGGSKDNPLGYRWMGLNIGRKEFFGIHGNNRPYSIGRNVSRGCVRMFNSDVEELYRMTKTGTPVWIGNDKALRSWGIYQNSSIQ